MSTTSNRGDYTPEIKHSLELAEVIKNRIDKYRVDSNISDGSIIIFAEYEDDAFNVDVFEYDARAAKPLNRFIVLSLEDLCNDDAIFLLSETMLTNGLVRDMYQ